VSAVTGPGADLPRLRGHHFVCLQFYRGEGYSPAFVDNLRQTVEQAGREPALLVAGADDVCSACPSLSADGTCADEHAGEVEVARLDTLAHELLGAAPGDRLSLQEARERIAADAIGAGRWRREACAGCVWEGICESGWAELLAGRRGSAGRG
jgi:hypothetical protein